MSLQVVMTAPAQAMTAAQAVNTRPPCQGYDSTVLLARLLHRHPGRLLARLARGRSGRRLRSMRGHDGWRR